MNTKLFLGLALIFLIGSLGAWGQQSKPDYKALKRVMLTGDLDRADSMLRSYGFHFDQTRKVNGEGGCTDTYTWRRDYGSNYGEASYYEIIALYRKCEGVVWYNALRYLTIDEEWVTKVKGEVKRQERLEDLGKESSSGCVIRKFKDASFLVDFSHCSTQRREYYLDITYDFPF